MKYKINIRPESQSDIKAITEVTRAAFKNHPFSQQTEEFIIHALRKWGALSLSLVAELDGEIVGHIAFSPVSLSDGTTGWYGLGPVSVVPKLQKGGIGSVLILEGLSRLRKMGMKGCSLVGDPQYYERFGFKNNPELIYEGIPQQYFVVLSYESSVARGYVKFHDSFHAIDEGPQS